MTDIPNKGGRPTKLTPGLQRDFLRVIRRSGFQRDACAVVGITEDTLAMWKRWGAEGREPFRGFTEALKKAEVERRQSYLRESERRGKKRNDPREIQWRAAVTDPEVFSIKHHVVVQQQLDAAVARLKEEFAGEPEILERALSAIAGESRGGGTGGPAGPEGDGLAEGGDAADAHPLAALAAAAGIPRPGG